MIYIVSRYLLAAALSLVFLPAEAQRIGYGPGSSSSGGAASFVYPTCANNTAADTASIQALIDAAPASGATIVLPQSQTCSISSLSITKNNITLSGGNLTLGVGLAAGDTAIAVDANNFRLTGATLTAAVRVYAVKMAPSAAALSGLVCDRNTFTGFFYNCAAVGTAGFHITGFRALDNTATAPAAANAGAFFGTYVDDVEYRGNSVTGGQNSSVYGALIATKVRIVSNYASGLTDTAGGAEACAQVENSGPNADAVIANNVCVDSDIWVSDSPNVQISNNQARRLRLSVDGTNAYDLNKITVVGGSYGAIWAYRFTATATTQRISADISDITLDPARFTLLGVALTRSYHLDGGYIGTLRFNRIRNITDASTYATSLVREASASLYFSDVDFGAMPHNTSGGVAGIVRERNSTGGLYPSGNSFLTAYQSPYILCQSAVAVPHTGDTSETKLASCAVPAGAIGATGRLRITATYTVTNNANTKTARIRFGAADDLTGTGFVATALTTTPNLRVSFDIANRTGSSQVGGPQALGAATANAPVTAAINTANASYVVFSGQDVTSAGDTITLEEYSVVVMPN